MTVPKLLELYKESFGKKEMPANEVITALRMLGYSESIATNLVSEWAALDNTNATEAKKSKKQRIRQRASLEKYVLRTRLGKKYYVEYIRRHKDYLKIN